MSIRGIIASSMLTVGMMKEHNEEKKQECIDKYWDACRFPRKIKKRMRKEAQKDYNFWCSMDSTLEFFGW